MECCWQGITEVQAEKPIPVPLCLSQSPRGLALDRTRESAARDENTGGLKAR